MLNRDDQFSFSFHVTCVLGMWDPLNQGYPRYGLWDPTCRVILSGLPDYWLSENSGLCLAGGRASRSCWIWSILAVGEQDLCSSLLTLPSLTLLQMPLVLLVVQLPLVLQIWPARSSVVI